MTASEMDKFLLLLLAAFPVMFLQGVAPSTLCMVCKNFKNGVCLEGMGNCTMMQSRGCRTMDFFNFDERVEWLYNHTELSCSNDCKAQKLYRNGRKISSFCCEGQDFCNKYRGAGKQKNGSTSRHHHGSVTSRETSSNPKLKGIPQDT